MTEFDAIVEWREVIASLGELRLAVAALAERLERLERILPWGWVINLDDLDDNLTITGIGGRYD